jgi:hypothetical protein
MAMGLLMEALVCSLSQVKPTLACSVMWKHSRGRQPNAEARLRTFTALLGVMSERGSRFGVAPAKADAVAPQGR